MGAVFPGRAPISTRSWSNIERGVDAITDVPPARWDSIRVRSRVLSAIDGALPLHARRLRRRARSIRSRSASCRSRRRAPSPTSCSRCTSRRRRSTTRACRLPRDRTARDPRPRRLSHARHGAARRTACAPRSSSRPRCASCCPSSTPRRSTRSAPRSRRARATRARAAHAIGLVPNLAASRIANRLDLRGPAYTIDAACASSLLAVDQACRELADRPLRSRDRRRRARLPRRHVLERVRAARRAQQDVADPAVRSPRRRHR